MNWKQLVVLWIVGLWGATTIILATVLEEIEIVTILFLPVLIIGILLFISFKKGLIQKSDNDDRKVVYKTTKTKAIFLILIGLVVGVVIGIVGTSFNYQQRQEKVDLEKLWEETHKDTSKEKQVDSSSSRFEFVDENGETKHRKTPEVIREETHKDTSKDKRPSLDEIFKETPKESDVIEGWYDEPVKVLTSTYGSTEVQRANNEVMKISVFLDSFHQEVKKGDTIWINTRTKKVRTKSGRVYSWRY